LLVRDGAKVSKGELVYEWDPYNAVIVSEHGGTVQYVDMKENLTYREERMSRQDTFKSCHR